MFKKTTKREFPLKSIKKKVIIIFGTVIVVLIIGLITAFNLPEENQNQNEDEKAGELIIQTQEEAKESDKEIQKEEDVEEVVTAVDKAIMEMSLEEKIGQLIITTPSELTDISVVITAGETTRKSLETYPIGGMVYGSESMETTEGLTEMLTTVQLYSKQPLLLISDQDMTEALTSAGMDITECGFYLDKQGDQYFKSESLTEKKAFTEVQIQNVGTFEESISALIDDADMIYIEEGFQEIYQNIVTQVQQGALSIEVIETKLKKILEMKLEKGESST